MSEHMYTDPDIIQEVHSAQDFKESVVDIYVSAESLKVYDNPWVEAKSTYIPGPAAAQQQAVSVISKSSGQRHHIRVLLVLLVAACLLLLTGIIVMEFQKRDQLAAVYADFRNTTEQLKANNTVLRRERDALKKGFCSKRPDKCRRLLDPKDSPTNDED